MKYFKIEGGVKYPDAITPMLATLTERKAFDDEEYIFEIKWDGYRAIAELKGKESRLYSRNGLSFAKAYTVVFEELKKIKTKGIIDGEIVVIDEDGKPNFQNMQNYGNLKNLILQYQVFDCLEYKGKNICHLPLLERKEILKAILPESNVIKYCDHVETHGEHFFNLIKKEGLEGMIAKERAGKYSPGRRSPTWLKVKNIKEDEMVIVGFTDPQGSRVAMGSLLVGKYIKNKLVYTGSVGTGYTDKILRELLKKLKAIEIKESPLGKKIKEKAGMHWVEPKYVCMVKYTEITKEGILRHPVYLGLRIDKDPKEVS